MFRFATLLGVIVIALASFHESAFAGFTLPDPTHCTLPKCIVACPEGDIVTTMVIRDFNSTPMAGVVVILDFSRCPDFTVCPAGGGPPGYFYDPSQQGISNFTNAMGQVAFPLRLVGSCPPDSVLILSMFNQELGRCPFTSLDQNGDFGVNSADEAIVQSRIGQSDWRSDLNCDSIISANDVVIVDQHLEHLCRIATPTQKPTWGRLKTIYR